jgi:hypothetical protein
MTAVSGLLVFLSSMNYFCTGGENLGSHVIVNLIVNLEKSALRNVIFHFLSKQIKCV